MNTKYIISLSMLIALGGAHCMGAAANPETETLTHPLARLYAEGPADLAPDILVLASLYRKDLLELARIGLKEPQCFPMLYQDAMRELFNQKKKFRQFLRQYNGDVNAALIDAVENNKPWAIDYLVQNGADVNVRDDNASGYIVLILAVCEGHIDVIAQLIAARANLDARDINGMTALMWAAEKGNGAVVAQLIAAEANVNARDEAGRTTLRYAMDSGYKAVIQLLIAAGAHE